MKLPGVDLGLLLVRVAHLEGNGCSHRSAAFLPHHAEGGPTRLLQADWVSRSRASVDGSSGIRRKRDICLGFVFVLLCPNVKNGIEPFSPPVPQRRGQVRGRMMHDDLFTRDLSEHMQSLAFTPQWFYRTIHGRDNAGRKTRRRH